MARPGTGSRRYAEALFEIATRDGQPADTPARWRDELRTAASIVADERVLAVADNPALPFEERAAVVRRLIGERVSRPVLNLVLLIVRRGRAETLPSVADEFARLLARAEGIVTAVVTSARPLTDDELAAVGRRVEEMTGASVELKTSVDPALIGGLTVRVGDRLIDASVRGRLERLRDRLVVGAR